MNRPLSRYSQHRRIRKKLVMVLPCMSTIQCCTTAVHSGALASAGQSTCTASIARLQRIHALSNMHYRQPLHHLLMLLLLLPLLPLLLLTGARLSPSL
jgi:hypothetical protein